MTAAQSSDHPVTMATIYNKIESDHAHIYNVSAYTVSAGV